MTQIGTASRDVAIVGMACVFPRAPDLNAYWTNILHEVCAITEALPEHWDTSVYYDPASDRLDRVYCRHGGFLTEEERRFRPLDHGVMPRSVEGGEPDHFLALRVATEALADAGYLENDASRSSTGIILGKGNYINAGNMSLIQHGWVVDQTLKILRDLHPEYTDENLDAVRAALKRSLPPFETEVIPSLIPNVMTGRIANRLDLKGPNFTVDAACASSLLAVDLALRELRSGRCDLALAGGVQGGNTLLSYLLFSPLKAMSRSGVLRALDREADGTILGEGIGIVVLKRKEDAERDRDTIYAVVRGAGVSSDGKGAALLAPRPVGAELALRRAYEDAGIDPRTLGLMEAHGTGATGGDTTEIETIQKVFGDREGPFPPCALGTAKSMVGHLLPAAGAAGLIRAALSLYHKVLPATLNCEHPNPSLDGDRGFFYVNTRTRPWIHGNDASPRRAGVSAFGFGGINAHVVLEEPPEQAVPPRQHHLAWDSELVLVEGDGREGILQGVRSLQAYLADSPGVPLRDLACTLYRRARFRGPCLAVVARSGEDLARKLASAAERLSSPDRRQIKDRKGIYYFEEPLDPSGRVAFLFPGEGAQYPHMLSDLCVLFPAVRECFDRADAAFLRQGKPYLPSDAIFPRPSFGPGEGELARNLLWQLDVAVQAVLTANQALQRLLADLGVRPSVMLGHSSGEYSAMLASGILQEVSEDLILETNGIIEDLAREGAIPEASMVAAAADRGTVEAVLERKGIDRLFLAMDNCPHQVVLVGPPEDAERAVAALKEERILCESLAFRRGYHTPYFEPVSRKLREVFARYPISPARLPVWSCTLQGPYPEDPDAVRGLLADHWIEPVAFRQTIEKLHDAGTRLFVEVGPRGNLTSFVDDILRGRSYLAVAANLPRKPGLEQLHHLLGILAAQRIPVDLGPLFDPRGAREIDLGAAGDDGRVGSQDGDALCLSTGLPRMEVPPEERDRLARERPHDAPPPLTRAPSPLLETETVAADPRASDESMVDYLRNMERFLEVQQEVMGAYLQGRQGPGGEETILGDFEPLSRLEGTAGTTATGAADRAGPPTEDSPTAAPEARVAPGRADTTQTAAPEPGTRAVGSVCEHLLRLVSEKTGYPPDLLDRNLDMEAELGIDSIKRIEILGTLQNERGGKDLDLEEASQRRTLRDLIAYLEEAFAGGVRGESIRPDPAPAGRADAGLPLVGEVVHLEPGRIRCVRSFSLASDPYLEDHVLAGPVSTLDSERRGLAVVPLTISMEMMAEVASLLAPGLRVVGMREVRTHRWIPVTDRPFRVEVEARGVLTAPGACEIQVEVREAGTDVEGGRAQDPPILSATVRLAEDYPPAPEAGPFALAGERASRWDPDRLYPAGMFHGPRFRAVRSVDLWGSDGATASFAVLPFDRLFRDQATPRFCTDPLILDAAGQLVGFWTAEHLDRGFIVFPYRCEEVTLHGPLQPAGNPIGCRARIELFGVNQVRSHIEMVDPDGRTWMTLRGWEDKRFELPDLFHRFWKAPLEHGLSGTWPPPTETDEAAPPSASCRVETPIDPAEGIWRDVWAHIVLAPGEREAYRELRDHPKRQLDWLLGRTAAKDAVRTLLSRLGGVQLGPADVEIHREPSGPPRVSGPWQEHPGLRALRPIVSLSHAGGAAVAWAMDANGLAQGVGVDLEKLPGPEGAWREMAFSDRERALLEERDAEERDEWEMRFWCGKESLAKAIGTGLDSGPGAVEIVGWGEAPGTLLARPARKAPPAEGGEPGEGILLHTRRDGDWIAAWTWIPTSGENA